jgi:deazaflavin-dependent oxidoreductase (nitroreductase family)
VQHERDALRGGQRIEDGEQRQPERVAQERLVLGVDPRPRDSRSGPGIQGRKSGLPRTTPVAIIEVSGRRWVWAPWGDLHWVRNLRAAGRATITVRRRNDDVRAIELDPAERIEFFRGVLGPLARRIPFGVWFVSTFDGVDLNDPVKAAEGRRVFELIHFAE